MSSRNAKLQTDIKKMYKNVSKKIAKSFKGKMLKELDDNRKATLEKIKSYLEIIQKLEGDKINEKQVKTALKKVKTTQTVEEEVRETVRERNRAIRRHEIKALGNTFHEMIYDLGHDSAFDDEDNSKDNISQNIGSILRGMIMKRMNLLSGSRKGLQFFVTIQTLMRQDMDDDSEPTLMTHNFNSKVLKIYTKSQIDDQVKGVIDDYYETITNPKNGSGWRFDRFENIRLKSNTYKLSTGKSYLALPKEIHDKKACVNPVNLNDDQCFEWCIILSRDYANMQHKQHASLVDHYDIDSIERPEGVVYPVDESMYAKYEELNDIQINVWELSGEEEEGELIDRITMIYKSNQHRKEVVNMLLFHEGDNSHYVWIKNLSRLFSSKTLRKSKHLCPHCAKKHVNNEQLQQHISECCSANCTKNDYSCQYIMPEEGHDNSKIKYINKGRGYMHPFHVIADFESTLIPCHDHDTSENTYKYQKHVPNSYGLKYCSIYEEHDKDVEIFNNADPEKVRESFVLRLEALAIESYKLMIKNKNNITDVDEDKHEWSNVCPECDELYTEKNKKVKHHDHITGKYINTICSKCNLNLCLKPFLPVYIHNLKGYDCHLFVSALNRYGQVDNEITCIPNNEERYISFSKMIKVDRQRWYDKESETYEMKDIMFEIRFLDTIAFMNTSLDSLVNDLRKGNDMKEVFKNTNKHFTKENEFNMMIHKGVYPYDYITSYDVMYEEELPAKSSFYSKLYGDGIDDEEYRIAVKVWETFKCKKFLDYHNLYLKSDVLLLCDVWANFRKVCYSAYKLDCTYYYTAPGLSYDAMLKMTGVELELLTEYDMYEFFSGAIRGGLSNVVKRYAKANTPEMADYNPDEERSDILYTDMNNLYGWAMSQYLPYSGFKWSEEHFNSERIMELDDEGAKGYLFEVDLHIPRRLHDHFNGYVPCPENISIDKGSLNLWQQDGYKESKITKLCTTFHDKKRYVVNYRYLKLVMSLGVELENVYRVVEYNQKPFMKEYIDLNTDLRKKADSDFGKDFFKLMNNSVFGKTMENVKGRINFRLISSENEAWRVKNMKNFTIFDETLVGVHITKKKCFLNKAIYLGQSILDDSKLLMYDFHYNFMLKNIDRKNIDLLFTDTDSLCYHIKNTDVEAFIMEHKDKFDLSNYDKSSPLYDATNMKVIGKAKNESPKQCITEFCGLRAKLYCYKKNISEHEEKRCKGVKRNVVANSLTMEMYKNCLFDRSVRVVQQNGIRSYGHQLYTETCNKVGLSYCDDKIYIRDDNVNTYNFGHKNIMLEQNEQCERILAHVKNLMQC